MRATLNYLWSHNSPTSQSCGNSPLLYCSVLKMYMLILILFIGPHRMCLQNMPLLKVRAYMTSYNKQCLVQLPLISQVNSNSSFFMLACPISITSFESRRELFLQPKITDSFLYSHGSYYFQNFTITIMAFGILTLKSLKCNGLFWEFSLCIWLTAKNSRLVIVMVFKTMLILYEVIKQILRT